MSGFEATYPDGRVIRFGDKARTLDGRRWIVVGVHFREERAPIADVKAVDEPSETTFSVGALAYDPDPVTIQLGAIQAERLVALLAVELDDTPPSVGILRSLDVDHDEWQALVDLRQAALAAFDG